MVTLYSTNCPACKILESKLLNTGINFTIDDNINKIIELGFETAPILEVKPNKYLNFKDAIDWLKEYKGGDCLAS